MKTEKLHDRLGSVRHIMDTPDDVKSRYTYDPFGEAYSSDVEEDQNLDNVFKFTGQYFDSEIDQYYLRARQIVARYSGDHIIDLYFYLHNRRSSVRQITYSPTLVVKDFPTQSPHASEPKIQIP